MALLMGGGKVEKDAPGKLCPLRWKRREVVIDEVGQWLIKIWE